MQYNPARMLGYSMVDDSTETTTRIKQTRCKGWPRLTLLNSEFNRYIKKFCPMAVLLVRVSHWWFSSNRRQTPSCSFSVTNPNRRNRQNINERWSPTHAYNLNHQHQERFFFLFQYTLPVLLCTSIRNQMNSQRQPWCSSFKHRARIFSATKAPNELGTVEMKFHL